ncbi:MAG: polyphenol oxidase family protein [Actinomycetota bacterium]|nr:polyphenol oxidase family protein [Actinomycetota bacterium]
MVMGADCNLMMVVDTKNRVIAAVHSGWKGTLKKILHKTIGHLEQSYDSVAGNLLLYLGPSIRKCCYHVKEDLVKRFIKIFGEGNYYYRKNNNIYLDLAGLNIKQARDAGLMDNNIFDSGICTFCDERFFSYRRNKVTGRQAAIGMIRG